MNLEHPLERALVQFNKKAQTAHSAVRLLDRGLREAVSEGAAPEEDALLAKLLGGWAADRRKQDEEEITITH